MEYRNYFEIRKRITYTQGQGLFPPFSDANVTWKYLKAEGLYSPLLKLRIRHRGLQQVKSVLTLQIRLQEMKCEYTANLLNAFCSVSAVGGS